MARRKIFSLVLAVAMVLTLSTGTFAVDSPDKSRVMDSSNPAGESTPAAQPNDMSAFMGGSNVEVVDEFTITPYPEMDIADLVESSSLQSSNARSAFAARNIKEGNEIVMPSRYAQARGVTQSWEGTLAAQDEFTHVLINLAPAQIVNASLQCPLNESLNYDLYIFEVDASGNLGNIVSSSVTGTYFNTYSDGTIKTVDEGVSFINKTTTTKSYAVIVWATQGGSATDPFILTVSLEAGGYYDAGEPNDSPYNAYGVSEGTLSGASLHVENDQDWFVWNATSEFISAKIYVGANCKAEVYTADGNKLVLAQRNSDGSYPIARGPNYVRVSANATGVIPSDYVLKIVPYELIPSTMQIHLNGDEGDDSYPVYPQGRIYLRFKKSLSVEVKILSASGYGVPSAIVSLDWESGSWNESTGNNSRGMIGSTDEMGKTIFTMEEPFLPPALGLLSCDVGYPIVFRHHYDLDGILVTSRGLKPFTTLLYHFSHSEFVSS